MKTYFIKMALRGISPMISRRLQIPGTISLAKLHHIIQIVYGWDDVHLHQFHIHGKDYGIYYVGGIVFSDDANKVFFDDFEFDVGDKFTYEYNFSVPWIVDIRIEDVKDFSSALPILCKKGSGMLGATKYDEIEATMKLLKAIVKADKTTTFRDIRPLVEALNAVRFNRHYINKQLQSALAK